MVKETLASLTYNYPLELGEVVKRNSMLFSTGRWVIYTLSNIHRIIHRSAKLKVTDCCIYPDPGDLFIREPFIVKFSTNAVAHTNSLAIIAIHTQPKVRISPDYFALL